MQPAISAAYACNCPLFAAALNGRGNLHRFPVLGDSAPGSVHALLVETDDNLAYKLPNLMTDSFSLMGFATF